MKIYHLKLYTQNTIAAAMILFDLENMYWYMDMYKQLYNVHIRINAYVYVSV